MRRLVHITAIPLVLWPALAFGQGPGSDPVAAPFGLRIVVVDVGQGSGAVVIGPTGTVLVVDGGFDGQGSAAMLPALKRLGVSRVHAVVATHYDPDHIGGLDEVMAGLPVDQVFDRGSRDAPSHTSYQDYVRAAGARRRTVTLGQTIDLGGGARARVLAFDGNVLGRASQPIRSTYQYENAASVVLRVDYGQLSMWLGGDLTGGGSDTFDMESVVAPVCGDVDVYLANHHGSHTSSNDALLAALRPEVCLYSCGAGNSYGHPATSVVNRLNSSTASRLTLSTTAGARWQGYGVTGTMTLATDGWRYRIEDARGGALDLYTDEHAGVPPAAGDVVLTELHRAPSLALGEYLELANRSGAPVSLRGLRLAAGALAIDCPVPYRLLPGQCLLVQAHGDPARNGGQPLGHCWPYRALALGDTADSLRLSLGSATLDALGYGTGFAGGPARAAERADLLAATTASAFRTATKSYGGGDYGTPGGENSTDLTAWPMQAGVEVLDRTAPGGAALHLLASGFDHAQRIDLLALAQGTVPGIQVATVRIPLNADALFFATLGLPGFAGLLPAGGLRGVRLEVPDLPGLRGQRAWFAHFLLATAGPLPVPAASGAATFLFP